MSVRDKKFCQHCGNIDVGVASGSIMITLLLLCLGIIPGLIYESWRTSEGQLQCRKCSQKGLLPVHSIIAQKSMKEIGIDVPPESEVIGRDWVRVFVYSCLGILLLYCLYVAIVL